MTHVAMVHPAVIHVTMIHRDSVGVLFFELAQQQMRQCCIKESP